MRRAVPILIAVVMAAPVVGGVESLRERSPFLPATVVANDAGASALARLELAGILSLGGKPQFSVRDTANGRSVWIGLGETQDGLTALNFDEGSSSVVIEGRGGSRKLVLRETRVETALPTPIMVMPVGPPVPVPTASTFLEANAPTPAAQPQVFAPTQSRTTAEAERDARLLVSDLLEISIQERRRHEEHMKRQAAGLPPEEP